MTPSSTAPPPPGAATPCPPPVDDVAGVLAAAPLALGLHALVAWSVLELAGTGTREEVASLSLPSTAVLASVPELLVALAGVTAGRRLSRTYGGDGLRHRLVRVGVWSATGAALVVLVGGATLARSTR